MVGVHDLFRRFSLPLSRVMWTKVVVKRGTLASGGEISRGLFVFRSALSGESPSQGSSPFNWG